MFISALIGQPRSDRQHQDIRFQIWCFSVIGFLSICRGQTGARPVCRLTAGHLLAPTALTSNPVGSQSYKSQGCNS
ncbi:uncharacterized [Tachysurus ichikawai]